MKQLIYIICFFCAISNYAQETGDINATFNLSEIAMLDLEPDNLTITLNIEASNEAGEKATIVLANNKKWINFSSAVSGSNSRYISIKIDGGQVPSGTYLKMATSNYMGMGNGVLGSPAGVLILSSTPQTIISNIKGAYTGNGINNGYELTYFLEIYDYKLLDFDQSATLSISLTLTDF
jgi:hypothetical protein